MNIGIFQRAEHLTALKKSDIKHHWHKRAVPVLALAMVTSITLPAIAASLNIYEISDGTNVENISMLDDNAEAAVAQSSFDAEDYSMVSVHETDENYYEITVKHKYTVTVTADGKSTELYTGDATVASLLAEAGVHVGKQDMVTPSMDSTVTKASEIKVVRVTTKTITETESIPYDTVTKTNSKWYKGTSKVTRKGENGTKKNTIEITYEDGKEVSRETVDSEVVKKAVDKVVTKGTKQKAKTVPASSTKSGESMNYSKKMTMEATAYSGGGTTASGLAAAEGRIAVDPRVIPLGTKLYISGYGYAVAADTGGAIKGNIIDVYFDSSSRMDEWGRRSVTVYVLS